MSAIVSVVDLALGSDSGATTDDPARPRSGDAEHPGPSPLDVLLLTSNAALVDRLRPGIDGLPQIALHLVTPHGGLSLGHLLSAEKRHVVAIDAALLKADPTAMRAVRQLGKAGVHLLLVLERIEASAVRLCLQARAHGCVDAAVPPEGFRRAVQAVARGEFWFPRWLMESLYSNALSEARSEIRARGDGAALAPDDLTLREIDVMRLAQRGLTNKQIGQELAISPNTVKKHLQNALVKHGIRRRRQLFR